MEEVNIAGKRYISSKRAEKITGYTHDYLGQLCRGGKLSCKRIGRAWYIGEESVFSHKKAYKRKQGAADDRPVARNAFTNVFTYRRDTEPLTPPIDKRKGFAQKPEAEKEETPIPKTEREYTLVKASPHVADIRNARPKVAGGITTKPKQTKQTSAKSTQRDAGSKKQSPEIVPNYDERAVKAPRFSIASMFLVLIAILVSFGAVTFEGVVTYTKGGHALGKTLQAASIGSLFENSNISF